MCFDVPTGEHSKKHLSTQGHQEQEKQEKLLPEDTKLFQKVTKCNTVSWIRQKDSKWKLNGLQFRLNVFIAVYWLWRCPTPLGGTDNRNREC